jgi:ketopantoate hydroxymethyltransferase
LQDVAGAFCPDEGLGIFVVMGDVSINGGDQLRHAGEYATLRDQALAGLTKWRADVATGAFPTSAQSIPASDELRAALALME